MAAPSLLLQRTVAEFARARGVRVGANRIQLMATHTHMAPGHYFPTQSYSGPFSTRLIGVDPRVLHFIAERVAQGLLDAQRDLRPARVAWHQGAVTRVLSRNRSLAALLHNRTLPEFIGARLDADRQRPAEQAIDPTLSVLRIDQQDPFGYVPRGVFAVFGVHPTALMHDTPFYSGDLFGYATRAVAQRLRAAHGTQVIAGIANGIEGDSSPARAMAGRRESFRLGQLLADEIMLGWAAASGRLDAQPALRVGYRELDFVGAKVSAPDPDGFGLCARPEIGTASGAGVLDQPTLLRFFPPYNAGVHLSKPEPCQGPKLPVQMLDGETEGGDHFPRIAPIAIAELAGHALVTLPAELTTVAGAQVRDAVADALGRGAPSPDHPGRQVVIVGLANEYLQYVATADEYALQAYEGASTLYGPQSAVFLADQASCLARVLRAPNGIEGCSYGQRAAVDAVQPLSLPDPAEKAYMTADGDDVTPARALTAPYDCPTPDGLIAFCVDFEGPEPERVRRRSSLWMEARKLGADGRYHAIDDDAGRGLATRYDYDASRWTVSFAPALSGAGCGWFVLAVGGERWSETEGGARRGRYERLSAPRRIACDTPARRLEVAQ